MQQIHQTVCWWSVKSSSHRMNRCTWGMAISAIAWLKTQTCFRNTPWSISFSQACGAMWRRRRQSIWKEEATDTDSANDPKLALCTVKVMDPICSHVHSRPAQNGKGSQRSKAFPLTVLMTKFLRLFSVLVDCNSLHESSNYWETLSSLDFSWQCLVSQGSLVVTQGFCTYISSSLVISLPAALYGLSHHGLAVLLPAFPSRGPQMPCSTLDCLTAGQQVWDLLQVCVCQVLKCYCTFQLLV